MNLDQIRDLEQLREAVGGCQACGLRAGCRGVVFGEGAPGARLAFIGEGSPLQIAIILSSLMWTLIARVVRAQILSMRTREFVEAATLSGASAWRVIWRHMLPNMLGPIIVNATLTVSSAILIESALSFIGFGVKPPTPALGQLISDGRGAMQTQWWLVTFPGLVIIAICLTINFIGDGLRDALDARQAQRS